MPGDTQEDFKEDVKEFQCYCIIPTQSRGSCHYILWGQFCSALSFRQLILVCYFAASRGQNPGSSQSDLLPPSHCMCYTPIKKLVTQPVMLFHALFYAQHQGTSTAHDTGNLHTSVISDLLCNTVANSWSVKSQANLTAIMVFNSRSAGIVPLWWVGCKQWLIGELLIKKWTN